jgi:hypothetical protein
MVWRTVIASGLVLLFTTSALAQTVAVPNNYHAVTNRTAYPKPAVPAIGAAGSRISDPTFASPIIRVTDTNVATPARATGNSFSTPSAAHQLAWNATSDRFYVRSVSGFFIPYSLDASTLIPVRIGTSALQSHIEPQFSFQNRDWLYAGYTVLEGGHDFPFIHRYDFSTGLYTRLLDLRRVVGTGSVSDTYVGAISSSATTPEKVAVMFGGCCQDAHMKVAVFTGSSNEAAAESSVVTLDTMASTITRGAGASAVVIPIQTLGFRLHHAWIDKSGRYVVLYPTGAMPVPFIVWDMSNDTTTYIPETSHPYGHDALGYATQVNQDCCTTTDDHYEGTQWQFRSLAAPLTSIDLIRPLPTPAEVFISDHTSWNNAQPDREVPILSSTFRYYNGTLNTTPWRAWDDEILALQTESAGNGAAVWRFAHHRSNVLPDNGVDGTYFWYQPRGVISPNGRWALFTSNWEKTLGLAAVPDCNSPGDCPGIYRTDVFIVGLSAGTFIDDPLISGVTHVKALHITELRSRIDVLRLNLGLAKYAWTDPALASGTVIRAVHLTELRTALVEAYAKTALTAPTFTDPAPLGALIRAAHINEVRQGILTLEGG